MRTQSRVMLECRLFQHFLIIDSRTCFGLLFYLSFAQDQPPYMLVLAAAPPHYLFLPISLNSLDLAGVRLLSPRDSQIISKQLQVLMIPVQVMQLSSDGCSTKTLVVSMYRFMLISSGAQLGQLGIQHLGFSSFILVPQSDLVCILDDVWIIYVLCEVEIVSRLFIPFLFSTWDV